MKILDSFKTHWLVWAWNHTPHCAEMSRLASQSLDQPLSLRTRLKMRLHHLICVWCKRYLNQLKYLHAIAPHINHHIGLASGRCLSLEAKQRITKSLKALA
jgi:hypothetical protein